MKNGLLVQEELILSDGSAICGLKPDERIKYLGCSFNSKLVFDYTSIEGLYKNLEKLSVSPLLKPDQKFNVINQYIFPTIPTIACSSTPPEIRSKYGPALRRYYLQLYLISKVSPMSGIRDR